MHILVKGYSPFPKNIYLLNIQGTKLEKKKEINAKSDKSKGKNGQKLSKYKTI